MTRQEQLFYLIKSLTKEEKRHFKLFAKKYSTGQANNYLRLFNAIDKQQVYNEPEIKKQFKDEVFIRQLTATKYYLQRQIIKSLHFIHYDDTLDRAVLSLHHQINILYKKGQYEICSALISKGLELCSKNDRFLEWIGFLKWELNLSHLLTDEHNKSLVYEYLSKISQLIHWFEINEKGMQLNSMLSVMLLEGSSLKHSPYRVHYENLIRSIRELIRTTDLDSLPLKARYNLFNPLAYTYLALNDFANSFHFFSILVEELKDIYVEKEFQEEYVRTLSGYIYAAGGVGKMQEVMSALNEIQLLIPTNRRVKFLKDEMLTFYPLVNCALGGDFYNGSAAIEAAENFLIEYKEMISPIAHVFAYYFAAYIHLANSGYSPALRYLHKAEGFIDRGRLPDLKNTLHLMEIILFFEQGKYELTGHRIRSLQRRIVKTQSYHQPMQVVLKYLSYCITYEPNSKSQFDVLKRFLAEIKTIDPEERVQMFLHFDIISWLQSKTQGSTFADCLRENRHKLFS